MSKVCGLWYFDSRPVSPEDAARVEAALHAPGFFSPQLHFAPGLLLASAAGSDAPHGRGLFHSPDGNVCLWDGRLDNRSDLARRTGIPSISPEAAIALCVYTKEGVGGLEGLVGDWSLCIWDANRRQLLLASDYAGVRPLYYHRNGNGLCWSSSLADLVCWTEVAELDDAFVAGLLSERGHSARTPYPEISPVPAGHAVSFTSQDAATRSFWQLPFDREIRYADERQYEERLLELFTEAVSVRISGASACAELSGGLDSSSVVCMADRLRRQSPDQVPAVTTFSYTHEGNIDARFYSEVERVCGLPACHFELRDCPVIAPDVAGVLPAWWEPRFRVLSRHMAAMGAGALLTGQLGDLIMGNAPDDASQVTEWLAKGRWREAAREAYACSRAMQVPIYPLLWRAIREVWFSWVPAAPPPRAAGAKPSAAEDSLEERLRGLERHVEDDRSWRRVPPGRRLRFRATGDSLQSRRLQAPEALQHLSYTHPYAHRPLVEFMLTIPPDIVFRPSQPRRLMRRAFTGLLPPMILNRRSKAEYTQTFRTALVPLASSLLEHPTGIQVVERGYVNRRSFIGRLERLTQGLDCNETQLRQILLLEFWLRSRNGVTSFR